MRDDPALIAALGRIYATALRVERSAVPSGDGAYEVPGSAMEELSDALNAFDRDLRSPVSE